jgi:hypothetical protein
MAESAPGRLRWPPKATVAVGRELDGERDPVRRAALSKSPTWQGIKDV